MPGIGSYTAGAICSIAFNQPKPILDGNVIRVLTRLFGIGGNPRETQVRSKLWEIAHELVVEAAQTPALLNQSLMELGALICSPRKPRCGICPVARRCAALRQKRVHEFPNLERRERAIPKLVCAVIVKKRGRFLVRQRPAGVVNAHLWEFPNVQVKKCTALRSHARRNGAWSRSLTDADVIRAACGILGITPRSAELFCTIKHSITRYRITLEVVRVGGDCPFKPALPEGRWLTLSELRELAFASAHRKILLRL